MPLRFCEEGGMLVGAREPLPEEPSAFYEEARGILGCNHIVCSACGAEVRNLAGARIDAWPSRECNERIYDDLGRRVRTPGVLGTEPGGDLFRVYACRCNWDEVAGIRFLYATDCDGWRCAGHPAQ